MQIILISSLAILIYTIFGYPIILFILSMLFGKKVNAKEFYPSVSIIISAYNEDNVIKQKLENCLAIDYPREKMEIIVASESTDNTNMIVDDYKTRGVVLYAYNKREGKRVTIYKTVPKTKGEIIVFSDANAMYEKDSIKKLVRNFADNRIGCVSGRLVYINPKNSLVGEGEKRYWNFELILKKMESRLFSLSGGVNGSIFAIRKNLYNPINQYRGDDYEISCRIQLDGFGVIIEPEAISYEETCETTKQEFKRKIRLVSWNLKSTIILLIESIKKGRILTTVILFSHRFLRYTVPIWVITVFISNLFLLKRNAFLYLFILQLIFFAFSFFGFLMEKKKNHVPSMFLIPWYFIIVSYAAVLGIIETVFQKDDVLWEKVR